MFTLVGMAIMCQVCAQQHTHDQYSNFLHIDRMPVQCQATDYNNNYCSHFPPPGCVRQTHGKGREKYREYNYVQQFNSPLTLISVLATWFSYIID